VEICFELLLVLASNKSLAHTDTMNITFIISISINLNYICLLSISVTLLVYNYKDYY